MDGNGVMIRRYVPLPGPDETLAMVDSTGVSYPLADSRGTPMAWALADGSLAVQGYGAFGEEGGSNIGRFGFTGQMRLPEIGLHYYKARFYDSQIGRFLTPDPAGMVDGPNLYAYVLNDPINFTDPSGMEAQPAPPPPTPSDVIVVPGQRRPMSGMFVDASACFTIPAFCTYHGGYTTYIGYPPPTSPIRPPDSGAIEDASLEVMSLVVAGPALKAASLIRRLTLLAKAGRAMDRNGLTKAGRSLQKHTSRPNSGAFQKSGTKAGEMNSEGQKVLDSILFNPGSTVTRLQNGQMLVRAPDGRGALFGSNGSFVGFREP